MYDGLHKKVGGMRLIPKKCATFAPNEKHVKFI